MFLGIKYKKLLEVYFKVLVVFNSTDLWYDEGIFFFCLNPHFFLRFPALIYKALYVYLTANQKNHSRTLGYVWVRE